MKKISVIVPSYKPGDYIFTLLNSILEQQSLNPIFFEVIVVLNGEEEPFRSKIESYIEKFNNTKLIYCEVAGVSNARNLGIDVALGEYIAFLDDDDDISTEYLKGLLDTLENGTDIDVAQSNFKVNNNGIIEDDYISKAYQRLQGKKFSIFEYRKFLSSVAGKLFKRSVIGDTRFDARFKISEDSIFLFEISRRIKKMALAHDDVVYFRFLREGSALRSRRKIFEIFSNYIRKILKYSSIYFSKFGIYNFALYLSRLAAVSKILIVELRSYVSRRK